METKKKHELSLAKRMAISLVCGLVAGLAFMFLREHLNASGQAQTWTTINNLLFQDITAEGAERAFGIFYIIGQLFIKALQLVIIPMVFTSISLAIGSIADIRTMGRISAKTLFWFLLCSFLALLLAGCIFWDPSRFAAKTSELEIWHGFLLMWAVCSGVIHGVGFRPRAVHWQGIFCPLIADIVLALGLFFFFF